MECGNSVINNSQKVISGEYIIEAITDLGIIFQSHFGELKLFYPTIMKSKGSLKDELIKAELIKNAELVGRTVAVSYETVTDIKDGYERVRKVYTLSI